MENNLKTTEPATMPVLDDFTPDEIGERLERVFNGYLGCDTGDCPDELQTNHHLIVSIIQYFKDLRRHPAQCR